jgi:hypothetical protein
MKKSKFLKLDARDFLKGLLVAVLTALLAGLYQVLQTGGDLTWLTLKPVVMAAAAAGISYLLKNLFSNSEDQFATNEKGFRVGSGVRMLILIAILAGVGSEADAQYFAPRGEEVKKVNPWNGFFRPVDKTMFIMRAASEEDLNKQSVWLFRPTVEITAMQLIPSATEGKMFDVSSFQSVGMGLSYQHFISIDGVPYNNYGFNFLLLFDAIPRETVALNISPTVTVSALKIMNFGVGYHFGLNKPFLLTGLTYTFD